VKLVRVGLPTVGLALWAAAAPRAEAHLVTTGMGPLYDGMTHFALSPGEVLPVVAFGLFAGLRGARHARASVAGLAAGWLLGGLAGLAGLGLAAQVPQIASAGFLVAAGGALAANARVPPWACAAAAAVYGVLAGVSDFGRGPAAPLAMLSLVGVCAAVAAGFVLVASLTLPIRRDWLITTARVAGSWLLAMGVLLAGWIVRGGAAIS
jgi:hypothetical protein